MSEENSQKAITIDANGGYTVRGTVVTEDSKTPVEGVQVELWDQDLFHKDDYLGVAVTDINGAWEVSFPKEAFHQMIIDTEPDIFFHLTHNGKEIPDLNNLFLKNANESNPPIVLVVSEALK